LPQSTLQLTGIDFIDELLGGGLEPGTLTVVRGATGVGKTQLGLSFLNAGLAAEGQRGVVLDLTTRGDSQQHATYAERLFDWDIIEGAMNRDDVWTLDGRGPDRFTGLDYSGKPVTRTNVDADEWRRWKSRLNLKLDAVTAFLYGHFVRGVRRVLIDGVEPCKRVEDSIQLQLIEYVYQQILRTDSDWVARALFRGAWLEHEAKVEQHRYDKDAVATVVLQTSNEVMLQDLMAREIVEGDLVTNANTVILLGRWPIGQHLSRAALVLKHRGQPCSDEIVPFTITDGGLVRA
jgi:KaiC/GvpD/RAD55 family RecA-like ATPase